jgi:hypothetical protein
MQTAEALTLDVIVTEDMDHLFLNRAAHERLELIDVQIHTASGDGKAFP